MARLFPLKLGAALDSSEVAAAIDGLYSSGRFEDIQIDAQPSGDGVALRIITKQTWFVGHIEVEGKVAAPPNRGQLVNATQLNLGVPYQEADLETALKNLKRSLESDGLYEATVKPVLSRDQRTQTVNFTFQLKPGKRARFTNPVVDGNALLSDQTILRATGWRIPIIHRWRQVTQALTRTGLDGIRARYQKQDRLTATVETESLKYDPSTRRLEPHIRLEAGPKVQIRSVEAKVSKSRLKKYVPVYDEGTVDRDLLVEGARNLRTYFQSQGYYDVDVDFRQHQDKPDQLTIEYVIAKGARSKLANVSITGNRYFRADDLRERMFLEPASLAARHGRYSEQFRKKDEEAIESLYKTNGFREVKVTSEVVNSYHGKDGQIGVIFHVDEGTQWLVDDLKVEGATDVDSTGLLQRLSTSKGQPYSDVSVASDRNLLLTEYYSRGYPLATFVYVAQPSDQPKHVNLVYRVTEGRQQFIREVLLSGITRTQPRVVERLVDLKPGDPLAPPALTNVQRNLYDLGIFAKVNTAIQNPEGDTEYRYVLYDFEEANRYVVNVGVGAEIAQFGGTTSNLSSPGGATGFSPRGSLDVSRLNFLGIGHSVSFHGLISNLEQRASIDYRYPHFRNLEGQNLTFALLYDNARDVRTFSSKREEASVQLSRKLSKSSTALFRFAYRRVTTGDIVIPALLVPQLLQPVRLGILSANFVQDRRDNPTDAHRGSYTTVDLSLASNIFGSTRNFARGLVRNSTYYKVGKKMVFARQTQLGIIAPYNPPKGISADDSVPLPERFFGGGANSHRGFPYNQAGPRDIGTAAATGGTTTQPTGFPLGGNALLFNTFELRFPLIGENIGGVLFHDAGNVYRSLSDLSFRSTQHNNQDFNYMVHAAGFGIRYKTPVGPVRLDLAYSINPPKYVGFKGTQLELLSCNPNIPATGVCVGVPQTVSHFQFSFSIGQAF